MKKLIFIFVAIFTLCSCSKDDSLDVSGISSGITSGTYVQVNGSDKEQMTIIITDNHLKWTCYSYGKYYEEEIDFVLNGNTMTAYCNGKNMGTDYWSFDGTYLTLGEIIYKKQ